MSKDKKHPIMTGAILRLFWQYTRRYKLHLASLSVTVIIAGFMLRFVPPLIIAGILERLTNGDFKQGDVWGSFGNDLILYIVILFTGGVVLWRLAVILLWLLEIRVSRDMHQNIFNHLMKLDTTFHANHFGGSLVSQTNKFVAAYVRILDTTVFSLSSLVLSFVFTTVILWNRAPAVVIFLLIFSFIFILVALKITKHVRTLNALDAAANNKQTGFLADMVTNVLAVKSFAATKYEDDRYSKATTESYNTSYSLMSAVTRRDFFFSGATSILGIFSLGLAIVSVVLWKANIATVFLVIQYTGIITQELWMFGRATLRDYNRAIGDAEEMTRILLTQPSVQDLATAKELIVNEGTIKFNNVSFNHDGAEHAIFKDFNLIVQAGQKVGLVGHSGAGKTTFTSLLLRFADIDSGNITIDGQNIASVSQDDLRQAISYVPQEPLLFHRSLEENIAYGNPKATKEHVIEAAKKANALEFIESLPAGFDTLVGERGVKLSGGQRQRIAVARAILKNAPILVLDEATSALDSESEKLIQDSLKTLMKDRTSIVIAHRLSTIAKLDRIIVLDNGKIVEDGTHAELLAKNGTYARLWSHQSGGFIES